jgi:plasmid stabilization system protein ParE
MKPRYTRRALGQIAEISAFLATDSPRVAARFAERVELVALLLARHPTIGRRTDLEAVRVFAVRPFSYLMFYRVEPDENGITVLRIRHMAREEDWRLGT